jgi:hypothetical protein
MGIRATTNENENEPVWLGKEKENCLLRSARDGAVVNEKKKKKKQTGPTWHRASQHRA